MQGDPLAWAREPTVVRATFEEFTAGAAWRALPLKIKLLVMRLWRAERDVPPEASPGSD
jgi:hypothetical protein